MKKTIALIAALCILCSFASCSGLAVLKKPYERDQASFSKEGLTITLTEAFTETAVEGYTVGYQSSEAVVYVLKESFDLMEGFENYSITQYEQLVLQANASKTPTSSKLEGTPVMEYSWENVQSGVTYRYYGVMLKGEDAFWLIQFACAEDSYEEYKPYFEEWAKSAVV